MRLNIKLSTSWNDLSRKQLENISLFIHYHHLQVKDLEDQSKHLEANTWLYYCVIKELLKVNNLIKRHFALKMIPVREYSSYCTFIFKSNLRTKFIPYYIISGKRYFAPHFRLKNCTIGEFAFADSVYYRWKETNNEVLLSLLCSILYRPQSTTPTDIDIRKPFSKILSETNADQWQKVTLKKRLAIATTFEGCRNYIVSIYPNIFPKSTSKTKTNFKPKYVPFGELISAKIEFDPSKLEKVQNLLVNEFFSIYERELIEIKKRPKK